MSPDSSSLGPIFNTKLRWPENPWVPCIVPRWTYSVCYWSCDSIKTSTVQNVLPLPPHVCLRCFRAVACQKRKWNRAAGKHDNSWERGENPATHGLAQVPVEIVVGF